MKQKTWITAILVGTLAANAVAYVVVRGRRGTDTPPAPPTVTEAPRPAPAAAVAPAPAPREDENEGLARARRASGLAALEDRDYERAVTEFTEALRLRKDDKGDLVELLRIAADLRTREQARATRDEDPRPPRESATPSRAEKRSRAVRTASARTQPREETPAAFAEAPRSGLLLVTSTPPGLTVLVDGKAMDLTPARLPLRAGTYRVALALGERRLAEQTVELGEEEVRSLNRDLSAELAPPPARPAPVQVATPAPAPASPPVVSPAATTQAAPARTPAPTSVAAVAAKGDLSVTSPSLYGEVWINNRPYGFPPVLAQGLPAGPARVEVRVNGVVKRKLTVEVEPGRSTPVRVR